MYRNVLIIGLPFLLYAVLICVMWSDLLQDADVFSLALTVDLLLVVPFVYFLLIRKTNIPKTTVVPVMLIGLLIGSYFLPKESQNYLDLFKKWVLPGIELFILTFLVIKIRAGRKRFKENRVEMSDFYDALHTACQDLLPSKLVSPLATEVAVFYYGFVSWKKRPLRENEFSYHKESGAQAIFAVFLLVIGIETLAFHFLLVRWSEWAAWILTILSLYTAFQVFGFAKSLSKRPIVLSAELLYFRYGILNELVIHYQNIGQLEQSSRTLEKEATIKTLSPLGELESHNMIIHLREERVMTGLYGMKKRVKTLALHIDNPSEFAEMVAKKLNEMHLR